MHLKKEIKIKTILTVFLSLKKLIESGDNKKAIELINEIASEAK